MSSAVLSAHHGASSRPSHVAWAVWIVVVTNIASYLTFFLPGADEIPVPVIVFGAVVSAVTFALCWWTWNLKRWAVIALTVVTLLNMLSSLPGIIAWPSNAIGIAIIVGIPLTLLPIWMLWHQASRRAYQ